MIRTASVANTMKRDAVSVVAANFVVLTLVTTAATINVSFITVQYEIIACSGDCGRITLEQ
jgi:hypothetical protein